MSIERKLDGKIIGYGVGTRARKLEQALANAPFAVDVFWDRAAWVGESFMDIPVQKPCFEILNENDIVLLLIKDDEELFKQLSATKATVYRHRDVISSLCADYTDEVVVTLLKNGDKKTTDISPLEIFLSQGRNRLDVVVRYLFIEQYFKKNDVGFALYSKMQAARAASDYPLLSEYNFKMLIVSYGKNGYNDGSCIKVDNALALQDGSHRLALSLYFNLTNIPVEIVEEPECIVYNRDWFTLNGFDEKEIDLIENRYSEIAQRSENQIACILWPGAEPFQDEIAKYISKFYIVFQKREYVYSDTEFDAVIKAVYACDDMAKWKIEAKIAHMENLPKRVTVLYLAIPEQRFRLKKNDRTISIDGEMLKSLFRMSYKKKVPQYFYDTLIHTADNFEQTRYVRSIFERDLSLVSLFESLRECAYVLTKYGTGKYPLDFPNSFPLNGDIDIVTATAEDYKTACETAYHWACNNCPAEWELKVADTTQKTLYKMCKNEFLIFQIDISPPHCMSLPFIDACVSHRVEVNGFYIPCNRDEVCFRADSWLSDNRKQHHLQYIKDHIADYDHDWVHSSLLPDKRAGLAHLEQQIL